MEIDEVNGLTDEQIFKMLTKILELNVDDKDVISVQNEFEDQGISVDLAKDIIKNYRTGENPHIVLNKLLSNRYDTTNPEGKGKAEAEAFWALVEELKAKNPEAKAKDVNEHTMEL